jgi:hypothetical protein
MKTSSLKPSRLDLRVIREHSIMLHLKVEGVCSVMEPSIQEPECVRLVLRSSRGGEMVLTLPEPEAEAVYRLFGQRLRHIRHVRHTKELA